MEQKQKGLPVVSIQSITLKTSNGQQITLTPADKTISKLVPVVMPGSQQKVYIPTEEIGQVCSLAASLFEEKETTAPQPQPASPAS